MGQQQLLLIAIGAIIVGIAVLFAIQLFRQNAVDNKRDQVINECQNLGSMALQYYKKPAVYAGGNHTFTGWEMPNNLKTTVTGSYSANVTSDKVVITGTGNDVVNGTDSVKVKLTVQPDVSDQFVTEIIN